MKALRFVRTGSLDYLKILDVRDPEPGPDSVLVRVKAAGLNPSDAKNVLGRMGETTVPRTPGRDFAGVVAVGKEAYLEGTEIFGTGGNLGFALTCMSICPDLRAKRISEHCRTLINAGGVFEPQTSFGL